MLAGCGKPVPPEKLSYVGFWQAKNMELTIMADGRIEYWRKTGTSTSKISAPIQRWEGDDFFVGIGAFTTRFKVAKPPAEKDGGWTMTVDGVELTRIGPGAQWTGFQADLGACFGARFGAREVAVGTSFAPPRSAPVLFT